MQEIKSSEIQSYFSSLKSQRETFFQDVDLPFHSIWERPLPNKWSIGETLYHLFLMIRLFRQFSSIYIPIMRPVAIIRKNKSYPTATYDIYKEFQTKKKKGMNAPFLIKPPKDIAGKYSLEDLQKMISVETNKLMKLVAGIEENIAGNIYYFDPVANNPNLIQSIHLLAIHEQHHFDLTKKYFH